MGRKECGAQVHNGRSRHPGGAELDSAAIWMADSQPKPDPPQEAPRAANPEVPLRAPDPAPVLPDDDRTADAPTIISRQALRPHGSTPQPAAVTATPNTLQGRRLAHFELIEPIGVGGMAAVIRARDTQLDRSVALKILPPEMAEDPENIRRFHQEARAAAKLDHENIARVFFCGEDQKLHFIAFEFVEGENLRTLLERRGRLPVAESVRYMLQVAAGLAHASSRGVVHRDIKPSNIIISSTGRAKLVDMGLARSLEPHNDNALTQSGVTLGTFDYISPEQALEPRDADVRSDIYSLGCTFYHMLTGQPPVPEGTAARKLNFHQNETPVDPRQLNPDIPDEVAAILARMMAKDPKDRYQRPEHLVQHLLLLAQKLGDTPDLPDAVLFVDAPLPSPPRVHPLLVAGVATAAVIGLIFVLGPSSWTTSPPNERVAHKRDGGERPPPEPPAKDSAPLRPITGPSEPREQIQQAPEPPPPVERNPHSAQELADALKSPRVVIYLDRSINLNERTQGMGMMESEPDPGLAFEGESLTIQPAPGMTRRPVLKRDYADVKNPEQAALTVKKGRVVFRRLRFEVNSTGSQATLAAVVREGGKIVFEDCDFVQSDFPPDAPWPVWAAGAQTSAVLVKGAAPEPSGPHVAFKNCCFISGQEAVTWTGPARVSAQGCLFGPYAALFHGKTDPAAGARTGARLELRKCLGVLINGAVFALDREVNSVLEPSDCVFTCPTDAADPEGGDAVLIRQAGTPGSLTYNGRQNAYHNIQAYYVHEGQRIRKLAAFQEAVGGIQDVDSVELTASPLRSETPLKDLASDRPRSAFVLAPRALRDKPGDPAARILVVVDPNARRGPGEYGDLAQAVRDARPGDVILVRRSGELVLDPVRLEKAGTDLTIRAAAGHHPVLTLGETHDSEVGIFRIHDGRLRFEGLEFALRPRPGAARGAQKDAQSVVQVGDAGSCSFTRCVITLDTQGVEEARFAVVTLVDLKDVMKMGPSGPDRVPGLQFENCFVRGRGDLVAVPASRPLDVEARGCLVALAGSFLNVTGKIEDTPPGPVTHLTLAKVTACLTDHLVLLRARGEEGRGGKGLVPTEVSEAQDCLFISGRGRSLIHLESVDSEAETRRLFTWKAGVHNAYSFYSDLLDQQPKDPDSQRLPAYNEKRWQEFTREMTPPSVYSRMRPAIPADLARARPSDFAVRSDELQGYGAVLGQVPGPAAPGPEPPDSDD
jgi:serine/threonine protein kinase